MSERLKDEFTIKSLEMAIKNRGVKPGQNCSFRSGDTIYKPGIPENIRTKQLAKLNEQKGQLLG